MNAERFVDVINILHKDHCNEIENLHSCREKKMFINSLIIITYLKKSNIDVLID